MSQFVETACRCFTAAGALGQHLRVKTPGALALAGATDVELGTMEKPCLAAGPATVRLRTAQGTRKMVAADVITAGNPVYAAASGKISAAGTVFCGVALETSTANNDVLEVLPGPNTDVTATITGTNSPTFEVDADSATPKIALAAQAAGTGDFTTTIKPEATLSADNAIICPESDGDTLAALALAQTFTARQGFTGNTGNTAGIGITGTAAAFVTAVEKVGSLIKTTILIDLAGLNSGGAADDIIGANGAGAAHLGQITAAINGTIIAGRMTCLETPATGDNDIDLWEATESTGVEDTAISALTETKLCNSGDLTSASVIQLSALPTADKYLYLCGGTGDSSATYSTGILLIELWGKAP